MKEFKGTPAPWKHDTNFEYYEKDSYSKIDAGLGYFDNTDQEPTGFSITGVMSDAGAKLIAAAPELLEALQELVGHFTAFTPSEIESFDKAKQVINKALS